MKVIDQRRLEDDPFYRYQFLAEFVGFGEAEVKAIHESGPCLVRALPRVVNSVYEKMFSYDITKQKFVPRHDDYSGAHAEDLAELTLEDGQVQHRKTRLIQYFTDLFSAEFDETTVDLMNAVGRMHTTLAGTVSIHVPLMQFNILMCYIHDLLTQELLGEKGVDSSAAVSAIRALQKLFWLQQSLVSWHY